MRVLAQRVSQANVTVDDRVTGSIGSGLLLLIAISKMDSEKDADWTAHKCANLRVFDDSEGKLNRSVLDIRGAVLVVSQFTLYGDCRKGMRPSYDRAAAPDNARKLYNYFVQRMQSTGLQIETGVFQANMKVNLINDGPVTVLIDSPGPSCEER